MNTPAERLQKVLSRLGLASRREAEEWIRMGRLSVNGRAASLGQRVSAQDQLRLDGRLIRQRPAQYEPVFLCHRSPGERLLPLRADVAGALTRSEHAGGETHSGPSGHRDAGARPGHPADSAELISIAERLPRRAGRRFLSVSPMPTVDGGLELLTADGALAARLQRAVRTMEAEFSLRVRGEISPEQHTAILGGALDSGEAVHVVSLDASGGEASNRWYRLVAIGASGNDIRQLIERQALTLVRVLRTRLGALELPRALSRSRWRELTDAEIESVVSGPAIAPGAAQAPAPAPPREARVVRQPRGSRAPPRSKTASGSKSNSGRARVGNQTSGRSRRGSKH